MELTRRRFLAGGAALAAGLAAPVRWFASTGPVRRVVRAVRGQRYPGRIRPLNSESVRSPARWGG